MLCRAHIIVQADQRQRCADVVPLERLPSRLRAAPGFAFDDRKPLRAPASTGARQSMRRVGSSASRSQSPSMLMPSTASMIASPGKVITHQAL